MIKNHLLCLVVTFFFVHFTIKCTPPTPISDSDDEIIVPVRSQKNLRRIDSNESTTPPPKIPKDMVPQWKGNEPDCQWLNSTMVRIAIKLKLLASIFMRDREHRSNIFFPFYKLEFRNSRKTVGYFSWRDIRMCVFASGGYLNVWEKSINHVYKALFGGSLKVLRDHWTHKHFGRSLSSSQSERELQHSEQYFTIFLQQYFFKEILPQKCQENGELTEITIYAFSWWDVCEDCYRSLPRHTPQELGSIPITYRIRSARHYKHDYDDNNQDFKLRRETTVKSQRETLWQELCQKIMSKIKEKKDNEVYWSVEAEGLELSKWLGQAFYDKQTTVKKESKKAAANMKTAFLKEFDLLDQELFNQHMDFLQKLNWEFSCWYHHPYPLGDIQRKWKRYWQYRVLPHAEWVIEGTEELDQYGDGLCEMCGNEDVKYLTFAYHPKHMTVKNKTEADFIREKKEEKVPAKNVESFSEYLKFYRRKKSIAVGSQCIKFIKYDHDKFMERVAVSHKQDEKEKQDQRIEQLEKQAASSTKKHREEKRQRKLRTASVRKLFASSSNDSSGSSTETSLHKTTPTKRMTRSQTKEAKRLHKS